MVPFTNLKAQYQSIKSQIDAALADMLSVCQFVKGPGLARFEHAFADYCGSGAAVAVNSAAAALHLALAALDVGPGDEVIVPALALMDTAEAVARRGARIVIADVLPETGTLDPRAVERCLTRRTRAVVAVHLHGAALDLGAISALLADAGRSIPLIEDVGEAPGARWNGRAAGTVGTAGCFSFSPGANLGAMGDAGAVITSDLGFARRMRRLCDHHAEKQDPPDGVGYPCRLDTLQAAVLLVKLANLERWNEHRRTLAALYDRLLVNVGGMTRPAVPVECQPAYSRYVIQVEDRDGLCRFLADREIGAVSAHPVPLHRQPALADVDHVAGPLPVAERWADQMLALPLYPEMADRQVHEVAEAVRQFQTRRLPPPAEAPVPKKRKSGRDPCDGR